MHARNRLSFDDPTTSGLHDSCRFDSSLLQLKTDLAISRHITPRNLYFSRGSCIRMGKHTALVFTPLSLVPSSLMSVPSSVSVITLKLIGSL